MQRNIDEKVKYLVKNLSWESSRIILVSIPYRSRIDPVLFSYRSPIVLASGSGNNTETIRKRYLFEGRMIRG